MPPKNNYSAILDNGTEATALSPDGIYRLAESLCRYEQRSSTGRLGYTLLKDGKVYYHKDGNGKIAVPVREVLGERASRLLRLEALYLKGIRVQENWTIGRLLVLLNTRVFCGEDESNLSAFFWKTLAPRLAEFIELTPRTREILNNLAKGDWTTDYN